MAKQQQQQQKGKKNHMLRNAFLIVIVLIIAAIVYFYYTYLNGGATLTLVSALASNPSALQTTVMQKINSYPQFSLSYAGMATMNITTPQGDPVVALPFLLSYQKYNNNTRTTIDLTNFPIIGSLNAVVISLNNGTTVYACYGASNVYTCSKASGTSQQVVQNITNQFGLNNFGTGTIASAVPSGYNNMPCFAISGSGALQGQSIFTNGQNATATFTGCFSASYYVPLWLNATIVPHSGPPVMINMHVVNISQSSSQSITQLPGPLVNITK